MFDLTLFRKPTFGGACIAAFALSASMFSMFLYLTLYLQNGLGLIAASRPACASCRSRCCPSSSRRSRGGCRRGCRSAPSSGAAWRSSGSPCCSCAGCRPPRSGRRCCPASSSPASASRSSTRRSRRPRSASCRRERAGMGSGINSTFRQVGIATGTAALGALFQHILVNDASGPLARVPAEVLAQGRCAVPGPAAHEAYLTLFTERAQRHPARRGDRGLRRRGALVRPHPRQRLRRVARRGGAPGRARVDRRRVASAAAPRNARCA